MLGSMEFLVYLGLVGILVVWFILPRAGNSPVLAVPGLQDQG
jgi:hypothetical protein